MIRERLPRATIITFWHIPWPNAERFGICPWREELIDGLLGSSILGFHTQQHCNNFIDSVDAFIESRIDRERHAVVQRRHADAGRPYPISIEWPVRWLDDGAAGRRVPRAACFASSACADDALLGVGVDRLDYTKGIEERLLGGRARCSSAIPSSAAGSRSCSSPRRAARRSTRYRELNERVEALAARINARLGARRLPADRPAARAPRAARRSSATIAPPTLCYVSSLHDGMNLVAKEFVAARDDERGVLVLSQFTGAARELTEALIVNPYDLDAGERRARPPRCACRPTSSASACSRCARWSREFNVYRWAGRMLIDAAQTRRRERLSDQLRRE